MANPIKLPSELDNPVDVQICRLVPKLAEWAHDACLTPNHITTISMIGGIIAIYGVRTQQPAVFVLGYVIAYMADMLDGYVARKYGQVTRFGDYYDHVKDTVIHIILFLCLLKLARDKRALWVMIVLLVALYGAMVHLQLMDRYHCAHDHQQCLSPTLSVINWVMPTPLLSGDLRTDLVTTRWFGLGTFATLLVVLGAWLATPRDHTNCS